jgi:hypothetical protein
MIAIRKLAIAALLLFAIAGAGLLVVCRFGSDVEAASIEVQRLKHRALARLGLALPAAPESGNLNARLAARGLELGAPVFIRIFKREFELELWVKRANRFELFAVYPICTWSGRLGPKLIRATNRPPRASIPSMPKRSTRSVAGTAHSISAFRMLMIAPMAEPARLSCCTVAAPRSAAML